MAPSTTSLRALPDPALPMPCLRTAGRAHSDGVCTCLGDTSGRGPDLDPAAAVGGNIAGPVLCVVRPGTIHIGGRCTCFYTKGQAGSFPAPSPTLAGAQLTDLVRQPPRVEAPTSAVA